MAHILRKSDRVSVNERLALYVAWHKGDALLATGHRTVTFRAMLKGLVGRGLLRDGGRADSPLMARGGPYTITASGISMLETLTLDDRRGAWADRPAREKVLLSKIAGE